jgi:hypothetical protein
MATTFAISAILVATLACTFCFACLLPGAARHPAAVWACLAYVVDNNVGAYNAQKTFIPCLKPPATCRWMGVARPWEDKGVNGREGGLLGREEERIRGRCFVTPVCWADRLARRIAV